jgi:radical SAM superfamily enzyme YgiQ (UPF0313 family)
MKVLLINPPSINEIIGNNPAIIEQSRGYNPPLGLLFIAGYLLDNTDYEVSVIDCQVEELDYSNLQKKLESLEFDIAGITVMTFTLVDVVETIRVIKSVKPNCRVVLGGPHVSLYPEETISFDGVDILVLGEGEKTFADLLENFESNKNLKDICGLVFKDKTGNIVHTGNNKPISDLDKLSFPARHLTPYRKYTSLLAKRLPVTTMFTSRGCPFKCSFCDRPHLGKKFRAMSASRVVEEFESAMKLGIHEFLIYDDTFTVNRERVKNICQIAVEKKLDIGFDIRARVDTLDEQLLRLLKKAGCRGIHYGVEAGTDKILKVLNKNITLSKAKEVFDLTRKYGIQTLAYFMIGSPTETRQDIYETFRVAKWLNPDFMHMTILTPFPGTPIYFEGLSNGIIKSDYWRDFAKNPTRGFSPPFWEEILSREELKDLIVDGYKSFYTRPSYILKKLISIRSFREFTQKAKAGLRVFIMKK